MNNSAGQHPETFLFDQKTLKAAAQIYRAVNNKVRQQILTLLHQHQKLAVSTVHSYLPIDQPATSTHLSILRKAGVIVAQREAKNIFYSINYDRIRELELTSRILLNSVNDQKP